LKLDLPMNLHVPHVRRLLVAHAGDVRLDSSALEAATIRADFERARPTLSETRDGVAIRYRWVPRIGWLLRRREPRARIELAERTSWFVRFEGGTGTIDGDLRRIDLGGMEIAGSIQSLDLSLPEPVRPTSIRLTGSAGRLSFHRHVGVPIRIRISGSVSAYEIDGQRHGSISGGLDVRSAGTVESDAGYDVEVRGDVGRVLADTATRDAASDGSTGGGEEVRLPPWLGVANRVIIGLQRLGLAIGTMHTLTVPGRRTGLPRTTPISPLSVDGVEYVVSIPGTEWVKNARVSGSGVLARGRRKETVRLVELDQAERAPILRAFPKKVPHGVRFFVMTGVVASADPDSFAAAAPRCAVFRVERLAP
jgi:hypothetical protein